MPFAVAVIIFCFFLRHEPSICKEEGGGGRGSGGPEVDLGSKAAATVAAN